jgi:hypothetical protein
MALLPPRRRDQRPPHLPGGETAFWLPHQQVVAEVGFEPHDLQVMSLARTTELLYPASRGSGNRTHGPAVMSGLHNLPCSSTWGAFYQPALRSLVRIQRVVLRRTPPYPLYFTKTALRQGQAMLGGWQPCNRTLCGGQESNLHLEIKSQLLSQFQLPPQEDHRDRLRPVPSVIQCPPRDSNSQHLQSECSASTYLG